MFYTINYYFMDKKKKIIVFAILVVFLLASCSITFYNQWHTTDSYINTENPTTNSADSSSINIKFPEVTTE